MTSTLASIDTKTGFIAFFNTCKDDPTLPCESVQAARVALRKLCTGFSSADEARAYIDDTLRPALRKLAA